MPNDRLSASIIAALSEGDCLFAEVVQGCRTSGTGPSASAIECELEKLCAAGVVTVCEAKYRLCRAWVVDLVGDKTMRQEAAELQWSDESRAPCGSVLQRTWSLQSLAVLERFLRQAVLSLLQAAQKRSLHAWMPHLWLPLVNQRRELLFQQALRGTGAHLALVIGGSCRLDHALADRLPGDIVTVTHPQSSPFDEQHSFYLHTAGEYLLLAQLDKHTAGVLDTLFRTNAEPSCIPSWQLRETFQAKAAITLTLLRDRAEALKLQEKLRGAFPLDG